MQGQQRPFLAASLEIGTRNIKQVCTEWQTYFVMLMYKKYFRSISIHYGVCWLRFFEFNADFELI